MSRGGARAAQPRSGVVSPEPDRLRFQGAQPSADDEDQSLDAEDDADDAQGEVGAS